MQIKWSEGTITAGEGGAQCENPNQSQSMPYVQEPRIDHVQVQRWWLYQYNGKIVQTVGVWRRKPDIKTDNAVVWVALVDERLDVTRCEERKVLETREPCNLVVEVCRTARQCTTNISTKLWTSVGRNKRNPVAPEQNVHVVMRHQKQRFMILSLCWYHLIRLDWLTKKICFVD